MTVETRPVVGIEVRGEQQLQHPITELVRRALTEGFVTKQYSLYAMPSWHVTDSNGLFRVLWEQRDGFSEMQKRARALELPLPAEIEWGTLVRENIPYIFSYMDRLNLVSPAIIDLTREALDTNKAVVLYLPNDTKSQFLPIKKRPEITIGGVNIIRGVNVCRKIAEKEQLPITQEQLISIVLMDSEVHELGHFVDFILMNEQRDTFQRRPTDTQLPLPANLAYINRVHQERLVRRFTDRILEAHMEEDLGLSHEITTKFLGEKEAYYQPLYNDVKMVMEIAHHKGLSLEELTEIQLALGNTAAKFHNPNFATQIRTRLLGFMYLYIVPPYTEEEVRNLFGGIRRN